MLVKDIILKALAHYADLLEYADPSRLEEVQNLHDLIEDGKVEIVEV